jgi:hypothetical protein
MPVANWEKLRLGPAKADRQTDQAPSCGRFFFAP